MCTVREVGVGVRMRVKDNKDALGRITLVPRTRVHVTSTVIGSNRFSEVREMVATSLPRSRVRGAMSREE